jgi:hypothetical protein
VVNYLLTQFPPAAVVLISDRLPVNHTPTLAATHQETLGIESQYLLLIAVPCRTGARYRNTEPLSKQGVVSIRPTSHVPYQP